MRLEGCLGAWVEGKMESEAHLEKSVQAEMPGAPNGQTLLFLLLWLSSPTRINHISCSGSVSPNHWMTRKVPLGKKIS